MNPIYFVENFVTYSRVSEFTQINQRGKLKFTGVITHPLFQREIGKIYDIRDFRNVIVLKNRNYSTIRFMPYPLIIGCLVRKEKYYD